MTEKAPVRRYRRKKSLRQIVSSVTRTSVFHVLSAMLAMLFAAPLIWAFLTSVKSTSEASQAPPTWFPQSWSLQSYEQLTLYGSGVWVYLGNTLLLASIVVVGVLVICVFAGYGFARFRFRGKSLVFGSTLLVLMVPFATILIPLYLVLNALRLIDTIPGVALILIMFNLPFGIFLMRNSFEAVPRELEEAALVDGANSIMALRYVSLPLVAPAMITIGLFSFLGAWNDFITPQVFLNDNAKYTLPIMLLNIRTRVFATQGIATIDYGAMSAGIIVATLPVLIIYVVLQRYFVSGLASGGLRG